MMLGLMIVAAGAAVAGYYGYRRLQLIEEEIRSDITAASAKPAAEVEVVPPVAAVKKKGFEKLKRTSKTGGSLDHRLREAVKKEPGILQTALYGRFPDVKERVLQQALLKMDREGTLRRTREKGSYALYPV
jgi:hypothetical protein